MWQVGRALNADVQLFGGPYAHSADELVVVSQHANLVVDVLTPAAVEARRDSEILDLTLLRLKNASATAEDLRARVTAEVTAPGAPESEQPLDQVLWSLRKLISSRYAGWFPSIGKNRYVGRIHGVGEISHGGGGEPRACQPPYSRAPRTAGPGRGVRVGVLDTGFYPQPWLAGGWTARYSDQVAEASDLLYSDGHATFVTGLVLQQAPEATVEVRRVLQSTDAAATNGQADSWSVAEAIVEFGNSGLDVLNLSFVCYTEDGQPPLVLSTAIDRLPPDLVVVAAAGNHGAAPQPKPRKGVQPLPNQRLKAGWPAALDDVIAVGAVTEKGELADFCPDAPWIDVLAVGEDLVSTYLAAARPDRNKKAVTFDGWAKWSGTSFAAALVSGAVAANTEPGRRPAHAAARDILTTLDRSSEKSISQTGAKILRLQTS